MKKISLSLPYSYLSGNVKNVRDEILTKNFGPAKSFLPLEKKVLSGIEISNFNDEAPPQQVIEACRTILKNDLIVILHCHLPKIIKEGDIENDYPWFPTVLKDIKQNKQTHLMLNLHALSSTDSSVSIESLIDNTAKNLRLLTQKLKLINFPIKVALEINREKGIQDPGTKYKNIVEICNRVNSPILGIGWDIGHTYSNVLNGHLNLEYPQEFLTKVIHTHIHDVSQNNETHWPLNTGQIPLNYYVKALQSINYNGFYTLEIYPERFREVINPRESILKSISVIQNT